MKIKFTLLALPALLAFGCNEKVTEPDPVISAQADTVRSLFANKPAGAPDTVRNLRADTSSAGLRPYAYFDLDGKASLSATGDTGAWDLAIRTTGIRVNGQFQLLSGVNFDSLGTAPDTGYTASGTPGWYDYNFTTNIVTPKAGTVLVIHTAGGKYAKIQLLSYYKGNPAVPGAADTARYYTFRYFLQADGSKNLKPDAAPYTYFSLKTGAEVADTSHGWDLALHTTTVKVNGQSQLLSGVNFDTLSQAPVSGYGTGSTPLTWYDYSGEPNHTITPKLASVLMIKTTEGKYAKLQFLSYYQGAPSVPNGLTDNARYYSFRYFLQTDGSAKLK